MTDPTKPPLPWLIAYRVLGLRLPEQHRAWVAKDVQDPLFVTWRSSRTVLWGLALVGIYYLVQSRMHEPPNTRTTVVRLVLGVIALALLASRNTLVRRTLRWQHVDRHGRAAAPKGLALLGNDGALVLGAAALVLFTGASAVFAYGLRPTGGVASARCETPDDETLNQIRAGFKDERTKFIEPRAIVFSDDVMVVSQFERPDGTKGFTIWIVSDEGVFELRGKDQAAQSPTTFEPPERVDRVAASALERAIRCVPRP